MQELIELAKAGKTVHRTLTHKEFVNSIKGKLPVNVKYDTCSDDAKQKWLTRVNALKKK
jgi:hypothetical protein